VTTGIISALGRGQLNLNKDQYAVENFIQTDAAINPGNSGGGLFNLNGSLVGINTAIASRTGFYNGYGFAIPSNLVKSVIIDLIEDGKIDRGYIGVQISSVDEVSAKAYKLEKVAGVIVQKVLDGSPAEKAGIEIGDVILDLDGAPVNTSNELQSRVSMHKVGDAIKLKILRDGKTIYKTVILKPRDEDAKTASNEAKPGKSEDEELNKPVKFDKLGFSVSPTTSKIKEDMGVEKGIVISNVERYGEAASRGIAPNGIILKANNQEISTTGQFKKIIEQNAGEVIRLQVKYKDGARLVFIEVPKNNS
jgi:serine protease Do